ncbi:MAG: hypothetical protein JSW59_05495, partial [Phycisphaerales bacterium]
MAKENANKEKSNPEVKAFAKALQEWAEQGPASEQRETLLKWLLSRCESRGFKSGKSKLGEDDVYLIRRTGIGDIKIKQAVMRAMKGYNPNLPTSGWVRGGPFWQKGYGEFGWQKAY